MPAGAFSRWPHETKCWQVSCSFREEECLSFSSSFPIPLSLHPLSIIFFTFLFSFTVLSVKSPSQHTHTYTHKHCLWVMASVFQLACNGPLTRLASGDLGLQQMLLWIGRSSAACRLYWIVIRVELTIHDRRSGFVWEGMLLHKVIFILLFSVEFLPCLKKGGLLISRINR